MTPKIKKKVKGKVLSLLTGGAGNFNYWHWLFDVLPRIKIAQNVLNIDNIDYFLFPNVSKKFQKETINFLNIPLKKCLSSINLRHFECNQLILTNHPYVINNEPTSEIQNLPEWIIIWLQNTFMQKNQLKDLKFPDKIFIDRADASPNVIQRRKIINNEEVKKINFDKNLTLKEGAQVMCVVNLDMDSERPICNGSQGVVVRFDIDKLPIVRFKNGAERKIGPHVWQSETIPSVGVKQIPFTKTKVSFTARPLVIVNAVVEPSPVALLCE